MTTNWNSLLNTKRNINTVSNFANGQMSGRDFYAAFSGTPRGGIVRGLLRYHGVKQARVLAGRALSRRLSVK
tara:strand:- start:1043 stop:1258 length:216 start_codon:yes stop_codon:yes gene_type:complete